MRREEKKQAQRYRICNKCILTRSGVAFHSKDAINEGRMALLGLSHSTNSVDPDAKSAMARRLKYLYLSAPGPFALRPLKAKPICEGAQLCVVQEAILKAKSGHESCRHLRAGYHVEDMDVASRHCFTEYSHTCA